jgi:hypothetical protein
MVDRDVSLAFLKDGDVGDLRWNQSIRIGQSEGRWLSLFLLRFFSDIRALLLRVEMRIERRGGQTSTLR